MSLLHLPLLNAAADQAQFDALAAALTSTLSLEPNERNSAQQLLTSLEGQVASGTQTGLLHSLLHIASFNVPIAVRQSAAIALKNLIKRHWESTVISSDEKTAVREKLLALLTHTSLEPAVGRSLREAVAEVARIDFPSQWLTVLPSLLSIAYQSSGSPIEVRLPDRATAIEILETVLTPYRNEWKLQDIAAVEQELKVVNPTLTGPLLELLDNSSNKLEAFLIQNADNDQLIDLCRMAKACCAILYSVTYFDLGQEHEAQLQRIMMSVHRCLMIIPWTFPTGIPRGNRELVSRRYLPELTEAALALVTHYARNYSEEFEPFRTAFAERTWHLLITAMPSETFALAHPLLLCGCLDFLESCLQSTALDGLIGGDDSLNQLIREVLLPCLRPSPSLQEQFECEPSSYVEETLEESTTTLHRSASDLIASLCARYPDRVVPHLHRTLESLRAERTWSNLLIAMALATAMAIRGAVTPRHGATALSGAIDIPSWFQQTIAPELQRLSTDAAQIQSHAQGHGMVQAAALRFSIVFRSHMASQYLSNLIELAARSLRSDSVVIQLYSAHLIHALLTLTPLSTPASTSGHEGPTPFVVTDSVMLTTLGESVLDSLLYRIVTNMNATGTPVEARFLETLCTLVSRFPLLSAQCWSQLTRALVEHGLTTALRSPANVRSHFHLFDTLGYLIPSCAQDADRFRELEGRLLPALGQILTMDLEDLIPLTLQLLTVLVHYDTSGINTGLLQPLLTQLLDPHLTKHRPANIPPAVQLLETLVDRCFSGKPHTLPDDAFNQLLALSKSLLLEPRSQHHAVSLWRRLISSSPLYYTRLEPNLPEILKGVFVCAAKHRTPVLVNHTALLCSELVLARGPSTLLGLIESIQQGLFAQTAARILLPAVSQLSLPGTNSSVASLTPRQQRCLIGYALCEVIGCPETSRALVAHDGWAPTVFEVYRVAWNLQSEDPSTDGENRRRGQRRSTRLALTGSTLPSFPALRSASFPDMDPTAQFEDLQIFFVRNVRLALSQVQGTAEALQRWTTTGNNDPQSIPHQVMTLLSSP